MFRIDANGPLALGSTLRKFVATLSGDAAVQDGGVVELALTFGTDTVYAASVYLPAAAPAAPLPLALHVTELWPDSAASQQFLDGEGNPPEVAVTLSKALTSGALSWAAYFE